MADRVVVVEDDPGLRDFLVDVVADAGFEVQAFGSADAALMALSSGSGCDAVLTDLVLPGMTGQDLLTAVRRVRPELNVLVMTAFGSIASAIELVRAGAYDYLTKPLQADDLLTVLRRALEESRTRREAAAALREAASGGFAGFVGASRSLREVTDVIVRAAGSRHPVLITGESGTGKELVARALHERSGRQAFVTINCGALPESLLESELFGHERGAFTGADRAKEGLFEAAHGGTLFLDEIGELSMTLQPKLLRALEEAEIRRVGATRAREVDVRVIAATNRDLEAEVGGGRFRDDLYWRLNVIHIHVPPLRERPADIAALAEHFVGEAGAAAGGRAPKSLSADAMAVLTAYPWPGNARELRNAIQRAVTLASRDVIGVEDLPPRIRGVGEPAALTVGAADRQLPLREVERLYVLEVLRRTEGNKSRAAEILGLDRKTLYRKLEEYAQDSPL